MGVIDFAEYLKTIITPGTQIEGNVVKIIADNGDEIGDAVFKVVQGGNGTANNVGVAVQTGATGATTTGLAYLSMEVGTVGYAIAPALGVLAGVGLYNLAPSFWDDVAYTLQNAGKTVGGKILGYWSGDNIYFDEETIEIFKTAFLNAGIFGEFDIPDYSDSGSVEIVSRSNPTDLLSHALANNTRAIDISNAMGVISGFINEYYTDNKVCIICVYGGSDAYSGYSPISIWISEDDLGTVTLGSGNYYGNSLQTEGRANAGEPVVLTGNYFVTRSIDVLFEGVKPLNNSKAYSSINVVDEPSSNTQPGAILPGTAPFPGIYPGWLPWEYPVTLPDPSTLPTVYPVKYPGTEPDPYPEQEPAQNPQPEPAPDIYPAINPDFDIPEPGVTPEPTPDPDPDPQPEPEPIPDPTPGTPTPDPVNPNPEPTPSPIVPVVPLPSTVSSNKLFTVYNPTGAQLDALGAYLWDSSIMASIRDIWQNPLDGIISLIQIYATPAVSGSHNIILGFLDSGVSSAVVGSQFVTIDCGTVTVPENKENATDYAPYTSLHLYLPFIGIVELDTNECMKSTINVKYKVDVYTGTCLATVSVTRSEDMPNAPILYTYSGNCSQQIPLTSGNATGMLTALIGGITAGLSVASGGGLGVVAGATIAGQSLTHEMFHVSHSGNLSANAGIMGQKKPYLIIGRRHGYDANNYNSIYGYPANKTIVLGNHTGYIKVKSCFLKTSATQPEHNRITELLKNGVIL